MLPNGQSIFKVDLEILASSLGVVFDNLQMLGSLATGRGTKFVLTPCTGFAPKVSGQTPNRRRIPWQFGAMCIAAPVS
jgi:hypothetical protein